MKKSLLIVIFCLLTLSSLGLSFYSVQLNNQITSLKANNNIVDNNKVENDSINNEQNSQIIDCTFTKTYKIVNLMNDYIAAVPEYSYVIVDQFQFYEAIAHRIPTKLKTNLKVGESYEFTYHLKGKKDVTQMLDIYDVIGMIVEEHPDNDNLTATLTINKTNKKGLEQIQESICG